MPGQAATQWNCPRNMSIQNQLTAKQDVRSAGSRKPAPRNRLVSWNASSVVPLGRRQATRVKQCRVDSERNWESQLSPLISTQVPSWAHGGVRMLSGVARGGQGESPWRSGQLASKLRATTSFKTRPVRSNLFPVPLQVTFLSLITESTQCDPAARFVFLNDSSRYD